MATPNAPYNAPQNNPNQDSNNTLYFIVGGLVVLALVFGFIYMGNSQKINPAIEPAAGVETTSTTTFAPPTTPTETPATNADTTADPTVPANPAPYGRPPGTETPATEQQ